MVLLIWCQKATRIPAASIETSPSQSAMRGECTGLLSSPTGVSDGGATGVSTTRFDPQESAPASDLSSSSCSSLLWLSNHQASKSDL